MGMALRAKHCAPGTRTKRVVFKLLTYYYSGNVMFEQQSSGWVVFSGNSPFFIR